MASYKFAFASVVVVVGTGTIVSYICDFGDVTTASGLQASLKYCVTGNYPVVLAVADGNGAVGKSPTNVAATATSTRSGSSDFDRRKSAPGVIRWFDFDSESQLGGNYLANFGTMPGEKAKPVIDTTVKASGSGSLRIDTPSLSGPNAGGAWFANFSQDLKTQFGENSNFFVQVRVRWNKALATTFFKQSDGSTAQPGIKIFGVNAGDMVGGPKRDLDGKSHYFSSETIKVVVDTYYQHKNVMAYRYYNEGGGLTDLGLFERPYGDFNFQNGMPGPGCLYTKSHTVAPDAPVPGCWTMPADEWVTFQLEIKTGPLGKSDGHWAWLNSEVRLWAAKEGQPSQLLLNWKPGVADYKPLYAEGDDGQPSLKFGKVWLLPYLTSQDRHQVHDLAQVWYDELIISTQRIPDPASSP